MTKQTTATQCISDSELVRLTQLAKERERLEIIHNWSGFSVVIKNQVQLYRSYRDAYTTLLTRKQKEKLLTPTVKAAKRLSDLMHDANLVVLMTGHEWEATYMNIVKRARQTGDITTFAQAETDAAVRQLLENERASLAQLLVRLEEIAKRLDQEEPTADEVNKSLARKNPPMQLLADHAYTLLTRHGVDPFISCNSDLVVLASELFRLADGLEYVDVTVAQDRMRDAKMRSESDAVQRSGR